MTAVLDADEDGVLGVYSAGRLLGTLAFDEETLTWVATCTCSHQLPAAPKRYRAAGDLHDHHVLRHQLRRSAAA